MNTIKGSVGSRIKKVRVKAKLSQAKFGDKIGVWPSHVSMLESGTRMPSEGLLLAILYRYGGNESWLFTGRKHPKNGGKDNGSK
jgi:transcriptional regulator with XRE-family HTH domain